MKKFVISVLILMLLLVGCKNNDKNSTNFAINTLDNIVTELPTDDNKVAVDEVVEDIDETVAEEVIDPTGKIFSRLTGLEISEEESLKRPIVVMLDNHFLARPQAGLQQAEVVYEILAEGLITRYMAVFQKDAPDVIGPVRSARPYYIQRALEFNPLYVHVGGSMQGLTDIINYKMGDVDGLSVGGGIFYRKDHKNIPHNMYSSEDGIRSEADRKKYSSSVEFAGMPISYQSYLLTGGAASDVDVIYKSPSSSDSVGYHVEFKYDETNKNYLRFVNGEAHVDETSKNQLIADNIIIQKASHKVLDDAGRREIQMVGTGNGYYVNKGVFVEITWQKNDVYSQTKYYLMDGNEVILNPGITWIQVIKTGTEPIFQ